MATCPVGHESATSDYCDDCGRPIEARAPLDPTDELDLSSATQVRRVEPPGEPCPLCKTPRVSGDRYCEIDGYDFEEGTPVEWVWRATVSTDRARFDALHPDDLVFPTDAPSLTVILDAATVTVGRRSPSRGGGACCGRGGPRGRGEAWHRDAQRVPHALHELERFLRGSR